jgi:lipoprotein-releasing system permease protein
MAMVVAMALMSGYTHDLKRKLIGLQGEIVASPLGPNTLQEDHERLATAAQIPGVRLGRVAYGEGSLSSPTLPEGLSVVLRGVDAETDPTVGRLAREEGIGGGGQGTGKSFLVADERGLPGVLVGKELGRRLGLTRGDAMRLVVLEMGDGRPRFHYRSVRLAGTFSVGFSEFDSRWVLLDREVLQSTRTAESRHAGLEVVEFDLEDPDLTSSVADQISNILGPRWIVHPWVSLNLALFNALKLQEALLFLVLGLIVVVSTFNVASTLVILVRERLQDIGVLGALGLPPRQLWWIFVAYGVALGSLGIALGVVLGTGISWVVTEYELVRFDPDVAAIYFIDSVPFRVELRDLLAIVAFSITVTLAACALPARRAAALKPSAALRSE